jgi:hypothetical protein
MEEILEQARNLGVLVSNERELRAAGFSKGKKVLSIISSTCHYCGALMGSWADAEGLKDYLSGHNIGLLFIERNQSFDFATKRGDGTYPYVRAYKNGKHVGHEFTMLYANHFIEWLEEMY